jgi:hypothetical protein
VHAEKQSFKYAQKNMRPEGKDKNFQVRDKLNSMLFHRRDFLVGIANIGKRGRGGRFCCFGVAQLNGLGMCLASSPATFMTIEPVYFFGWAFSQENLEGRLVGKLT